jgi:hypothetical protein
MVNVPIIVLLKILVNQVVAEVGLDNSMVMIVMAHVLDNAMARVGQVIAFILVKLSAEVFVEILVQISVKVAVKVAVILVVLILVLMQ